jgi:hypothetical protein
LRVQGWSFYDNRLFSLAYIYVLLYIYICKAQVSLITLARQEQVERRVTQTIFSRNV